MPAVFVVDQCKPAVLWSAATSSRCGRTRPPQASSRSLLQRFHPTKTELHTIILSNPNPAQTVSPTCHSRLPQRPKTREAEYKLHKTWLLCRHTSILTNTKCRRVHLRHHLLRAIDRRRNMIRLKSLLAHRFLLDRLLRSIIPTSKTL